MLLNVLNTRTKLAHQPSRRALTYLWSRHTPRPCGYNRSLPGGKHPGLVDCPSAIFVSCHHLLLCCPQLLLSLPGRSKEAARARRTGTSYWLPKGCCLRIDVPNLESVNVLASTSFMAVAQRYRREGD